jgi:hypothetical protein
MKLVGLDCGKRAVTYCCLETLPEDIKRFCNRADYDRLTDSPQDLAKLATLGDLYLIEPTGVYYRVFLEYLEAKGKTVRLVNSRAVRDYAKSYSLLTKSDRVDPAIIACYGWERGNQPGKLFTIDCYELRDFCSEQKSVAATMKRQRTQLLTNLMREWPEIEKVFKESDRNYLDPDAPALIRFLAGEPCYNSKTRQKQLAATQGTGLSEQTRYLARLLLASERREYELEKQLEALLDRPQYRRYISAYRAFKVPRKYQGYFLSRHIPFERFLDNGQERIDYVCGPQSKRTDRRTKRNRSLQGWMNFNGLGKVQSQSGADQAFVPTGSTWLRSLWWQSVKVAVVVNRPKMTLPQEKPGIPYHRDPFLVDSLANHASVHPDLASLWLRYEWLKLTVHRDNSRIMACARAMATGVYRHLLASTTQGIS